MHYVTDLSLEERILFLSALAHLTRADGVIEMAEARYISLAARAYDIPDDVVRETILINDEDIFESIKKIESPTARRYLIREMLSLAHADGDLAAEEKDFIFKLGTGLGLTEPLMEDLLAWAIETYELQLEGARLVEEGDTDEAMDKELAEAIQVETLLTAEQPLTEES